MADEILHGSFEIETGDRDGDVERDQDSDDVGQDEESSLLTVQENEEVVAMQEEGGRHLGQPRSWKIGKAFGLFAISFISTFFLFLIYWFAEGRTLRKDYYQQAKISRGTSHGSGDCHRTEVDHLSDCPELMGLLPTLLENKRALLGLSLQALLSTPSASDQKNPLMLTGPFIRETADVFYSSDSSPWWWRFRRIVRPQKRFSNRIDDFYKTKLDKRRPVIVLVTGADVCHFLKDLVEISPINGTSSPQDVPNMDVIEELLTREDAPSFKPVGETPLVLLTIGWDRHGSPFKQKHGGIDRCSQAILDLPQVVQWFVSHEAGGSLLHDKVEYIGIGFGGSKPRSGLTQSTYPAAVKRKLRSMESCPEGEAGSFDLLFMCNNNASNTPRPGINAALFDPSPTSEGPGSDPSPPSHPTKVIPTNRFPMDPLETLVASMDGIFAISPGGTRPDCFRHYEYLLAGNIVFLPGSPSLRRVFSGLPVVFMEDGPKAWGKLTCNVLAGHATEVAKRLKRARESGGIPPYQFEKLTLDYWKFFLMDRIEDVWTAASTKDKGQLDSRGPGS